MTDIPVVELRGSSGERGRQHGRTLRRRIEQTIEFYGGLFGRLRLSSDDVHQRAARFVEPTHRLNQLLATELEGVSEGARCHLHDIYAVTARYEITFTQVTLGEYSNVFVGAARSTTGSTVLGQNWDWRPEVAAGLDCTAKETTGGAACTFCRIVAGRSPCSCVHENEISLGFMRIRPARPGDLMIISKEHIDHFCDLPDELAAHILLVAQALCRVIRRTFTPQHVRLIVHGFGVPHAHLIVVPQHQDTDITSGRFAYLDDGRIRFSAHQLRQLPRPEFDTMAASLAERPLSWVRRERERGAAER